MSIEMQEALAKVSSVEETPSETEPKVEAESPVEEPVVEPEQAKGDVLYETPDGRKLTAEQLQVEWKEKFLPDYTRKAQKLAEIEKTNNKDKEVNNSEKPKWEDPSWVPESYAEIIKVAEQRALERVKAERQQEIEQKSQIEKMVTEQLNEIKKEEPNLNEDLLFQHANKYQFSDLKLAYENMKEMKLAIKKTEEKVVNNIKARENDIVSAGSKPGTATSGSNYWDIANDRGSARDYLSRVSAK